MGFIKGIGLAILLQVSLILAAITGFLFGIIIFILNIPFFIALAKN